MRFRVTLIALSGLVLVEPGRAAADDAGEAGTNGDSGIGTPEPSLEAAAVACDGALCDTTNGSECGVVGRSVGNAHVNSTSIAVLVAVLAFGMVRRAGRGAPRPPVWSEPR